MEIKIRIKITIKIKNDLLIPTQTDVFDSLDRLGVGYGFCT